MISKETSDNLDLQATIFSRYLVNKLPNKLSRSLYQKLVSDDSLIVSDRDLKLLHFVEHNPWSIGLVEAGLVFVRPESALRQRLYIMLAILESMPEYHKDFLPKEASYLYLINVVWYGLRGFVKAIMGIILIKAYRL